MLCWKQDEEGRGNLSLVPVQLESYQPASARYFVPACVQHFLNKVLCSTDMEPGCPAAEMWYSPPKI